jgi:hemolysin III
MAGGLLYSIGVIFYKMKKRRFMHSVWHLFVLGGSAFLYFFMFFNVL